MTIGHDDLPGRRRRSSSSRPRTRSRRRARTRCPRRRSTGSCSRSCSATRAPPRRPRSSPARFGRRPPSARSSTPKGCAPPGQARRHLRRPARRQLRRRAGRGHAQAHLLGRARARVRTSPTGPARAARSTSSTAPAPSRCCAADATSCPSDVTELAPDVLRHRLVMSYAALADGVTPDAVIAKVVDARPGAAARVRGGAHRVTDLARVTGAPRTPARPGPGPIADDLVRRLEVALARRVGGRMVGDHRGRGLGLGLDLDRIRPYEAGDDIRRIDWNATARSLVPAGPRGRARPPADRVAPARHARRRCTSAPPIAARPTSPRARRSSSDGSSPADPTGSASSRSGPAREPIMPPAGGRNGDARPASRARHRGARGRGRLAPSLAQALHVVATSRTTAGLVTIVSDFRGPLDWRAPLTAVAGRHTVLAIEIVDPREDVARRRRRADPRSIPRRGRTLRVDTGDRRLRRAFDAAAAADRAAVAAEFRRLGVRHLRLTTEGCWLDSLARGLDPTGRPA